MYFVPYNFRCRFWLCFPPDNFTFVQDKVSSAVDVLGPRQRYRGQASEAQNLNEISKSFVLNLVSPLFVAFGKQHFVDLKIALPIKIVDCISNIAYWFNFDTRYNG